MSDTETDPEIQTPADSKEPVTPKNQLVALLTLLPVLGALWLVMTYLPKLGDWMGAKADSVVQTVSSEEPASGDTTVKATVSDEVVKNEVEVETSNAIESTDTAAASASASGEKAGYEEQLVEQLGGPQKAEVRHIAISDDNERMVAALKLIQTDGDEAQLIEVFFDRDEFGRFISVDDSPVPTPLTLWSE